MDNAMEKTMFVAIADDRVPVNIIFIFVIVYFAIQV